MADDKSLKNLTTAVYALQAAGFLIGITWIVALVIDYVKRDEAKGRDRRDHIPHLRRLVRPDGRRGLDHLPHRQRLALPERQ
jgi:uncharacterized membrane protein